MVDVIIVDNSFVVDYFVVELEADNFAVEFGYIHIWIII